MNENKLCRLEHAVMGEVKKMENLWMVWTANTAMCLR